MSAAATQAARIAQLEAQVAELRAALHAYPEVLKATLHEALNSVVMPLAVRVKHAHDRINAAGHLVKHIDNLVQKHLQ